MFEPYAEDFENYQTGEKFGDLVHSMAINAGPENMIVDDLIALLRGYIMTRGGQTWRLRPVGNIRKYITYDEAERLHTLADQARIVSE